MNEKVGGFFLAALFELVFFFLYVLYCVTPKPKFPPRKRADICRLVKLSVGPAEVKNE